MNKHKLIEAQYLKIGDVIAWNSGYFDVVEAIEDTKLGEIRTRFSNDTHSIAFLPSDVLQIIR